MVGALVCLVALNLFARTGRDITWSYKGHYHSETAASIKVLTPSGISDETLIPVEDYSSSKDTGQRVQVLLVNSFCVPWYRKLADGNLLIIFAWLAIGAIGWAIDRAVTKRRAAA